MFLLHSSPVRHLSNISVKYIRYHKCRDEKKNKRLICNFKPDQKKNDEQGTIDLTRDIDSQAPEIRNLVWGLPRCHALNK